MCYTVAREWGHSWHDFLSLPIPLWWYEFEAKVKESKQLKELQDKGTPGLGGFTKAEWAKARAAHKEKKNGN